MHKIGDIVQVDSIAVSDRIDKWKADPKICTEEMEFDNLIRYFGQRGIIKTDTQGEQEVEFADGFIGTFYPDELDFIRPFNFEYSVFDPDPRSSYVGPKQHNIYDMLERIKAALLKGATRIEIIEVI